MWFGHIRVAWGERGRDRPPCGSRGLSGYAPGIRGVLLVRYDVAGRAPCWERVFELLPDLF